MLAYCRFGKMKIEKFDTFLSECAEPVNIVVDICNDINECITDIKDAAAVCIGAYKVGRPCVACTVVRLSCRSAEVYFSRKISTKAY